jgi:sensor c-di-GMP phosphodiesterase-like protein
LALFHRYKWIAAVVGMLLTGVPLLWFTSWLQRQGEAEVEITAQWSAGIADLMISQAAASLNDLAARNVDSCQAANVEQMRRAVFASMPIRELSLVDPSGQTLCTDSGRPAAGREVLASAATSRADIMLDVLKLDDSNERLLRVRRLAPRKAPMLAALLRPALLLPQVSPDGKPFAGYARMTLADGTVIGTAGSENALVEDNLVGHKKSQIYGQILTVAMQRGGHFASYDDLRRIGMVVTGLIALAILLCAVVIPWRAQRAQSGTSEIEKALAAGEFIPYYQPIVDITSGKLLGAEVLVRWRKPDGTVVSPGAFIPLIESSGLVLDLTRSLMRQVCIDIGAIMEARPDMYVTFNIAPRHFTDSVVLNDVGAIFEGSPIRLSQVVLEVTERYELENLNAARRVIAALQALGCRVALDDVGTGHSGLSYILKLGVDIIKIDRLFVEAVKSDPHTQAIVATLVDLARNLHMKIVAEGVEHFEQVIYLREHGITAAQGYHFAPPLPCSVFTQLVQTLDKGGSGTAETKQTLPAGAKGYGPAVGRMAAA